MADARRTIWLVAGESSGDMYGAQLARALWQRSPELVLRGMGGHAMTQAGVDCFVDSTELGVVGIVEVLKSIRFFLKLLKSLEIKAMEERPDAVVLIDYPGFNLNLAQRLHRLGIPVVYYISPQIWAWRKGRIRRIVRDVDKMLCIFPFEPAVYANTPLDVTFVGHPLLEQLAPLRETPAQRDPNLVLLLPGSRRSELKAMLPFFIRTAAELHRRRPELTFVMPLPREGIQVFAKEQLTKLNAPDVPEIRLTVGDTRQWMRRASAGLAKSGTVTVEALILNLPLVVTYKVNWLTWRIGKLLVKLSSITIANLIAGKTVFEEYLQHDAVPEKLAPALLDILPEGRRRQQVEEDMRQCRERLGEKLNVSQNVADAVLACTAHGADKGGSIAASDVKSER